MPPFGSKGLMEGEMRGRRAGDARTEEEARFLEVREARRGVLRAGATPCDAELAWASRYGLWPAEVGAEILGLGRAKEGEGRGWKPGVLLPVELSVGVVWPSDWVSMWVRLRRALGTVSASGRVKPSTSISMWWLVPDCTMLGDCVRRIRDAGVAGDPSVSLSDMLFSRCAMI